MIFFLHFSIHATLNFPYYAVALPMVILLAIGVVLLEVFIDWEEDLDPSVSIDIVHF